MLAYLPESVLGVTEIRRAEFGGEEDSSEAGELSTHQPRDQRSNRPPGAEIEGDTQPPLGTIMASASSPALSPPTRCSTQAKANSRAVPGP